jgi:hypothetical protein
MTGGKSHDRETIQDWNIKGGDRSVGSGVRVKRRSTIRLSPRLRLEKSKGDVSNTGGGGDLYDSSDYFPEVYDDSEDSKDSDDSDSEYEFSDGDHEGTNLREDTYECKCLISYRVIMRCFPLLTLSFCNADNTINETMSHIKENDFTVDVFLIFEEMQSVGGQGPPSARKDLSEFLNEHRKPFIMCYHVVAVNPTAQVYLVRDLHNTVHGGLLRPAIELFLNAVTDCGIPHVYYGASVPTHSNIFLRIRNGCAATHLRSFEQLDFKIPMSKVKANVVGDRWNSQYTWGVASMNLKKGNPQELVNRATHKSANVTDRMLPQFKFLTDILLELDPTHDFYCGPVVGNYRRKQHAQKLMEDDPTIPLDIVEKNVIESVSGILNVYSTNEKGDMFSGVCGNGSPHLPQESKKKQKKMKEKFCLWKIDMKWVVLFPHVDDFNARDEGQNFLGSVSITVASDTTHPDLPPSYVTKHRQLMTFCQRKVHEDASIREKCAMTIRDSIMNWRQGLPIHRSNDGIQEFAWSIGKSRLSPNEIMYRPTNENKCMYYSMFCSDHRKVTEKFELGLVRRVEAWACLIYCNGPEKHHQFFQYLLTLDELPSESLPYMFITYCNNTLGGSVYSTGNGKRHRPHWMMPLLKAEMMYGNRVLLSIVEDVNNGELSKKELLKRFGEVKFAGPLMSNHLLSVGVLSGLLIPRDLLASPIVADTLIKKVKSTLFHDDKTMTPTRIVTAFENTCASLQISRLVGEHALCETVRETKGVSAGMDAFHKDQYFVWLSDNDIESGRLSVMSCGSKMIQYRTEDDDRESLNNLQLEDNNKVKHRWWKPKACRTACLLHFLNECQLYNGDPGELLYSTIKSKEKLSKEKDNKLWKNYMSNYSIERGKKRTALEKKGGGKGTRVSNSGKKKHHQTAKRRRIGDSDCELPRIPEHPPLTDSTSTIHELQLFDAAVKAVKECWGVKTLSADARIDSLIYCSSYKKVGMLFYSQLLDKEEKVTSPISEYPPSVLDDNAISLPDGSGVGWRKKRDVNHAVQWYIICKMQSAHSIRNWAEKILRGNNTSAVMVGSRLWCTMYKLQDGSIWVRYKERFCLLID